MFLHIKSSVVFPLLFIQTTLVCSSQAYSSHHENGETEETLGYTYMFHERPVYSRDCFDAMKDCYTSNVSGIYYIKPVGYPEPFEVYCDSTIGSGGWTVIHRVQDGSLFLNRTWSEYKSGFGFLYQEFWIGNEKLSFLTNQNSYELRIDITTENGPSFHVTYRKFRINDEYSGYKLISVGEYNGVEGVFNIWFCPSSNEGAVYVAPDCSRRCSCTDGQFICDYAYRCGPNASCEERNNVVQCYCNAGFKGDGLSCSYVVDCQDVYEHISNHSKVYQIKPTTWQGEPFDVFCNMAEGGGWTVFQRRMDGSQNFFLNWTDYKAGFGTPDRELWLGNDKLHSLVSQKNYEFRVDVINNAGDPYYAIHRSFIISNESDNYRLGLGKFIEGTAGSGLNLNNGQVFTTPDRDNDAHRSANCATKEHGGKLCGGCSNNAAWWYNGKDDHCSNAHLNGPFHSTCFRWGRLPGEGRCPMQYTEMKVRPIGP